MKHFSVKNYEQFQHYKDRSPPWIKLYGSLLDDYGFTRLPDSQRWHLLGIWLLASKLENKIPWDADWLARKLGTTEPIDLDALAAAGFIVDYSEKAARGKAEAWPTRYIPATVRAEVLSAAGNKCQRCDSTERLEIDHIKPISHGGTGEKSNLQVLCVSCNRKKRAEQLRSKVSAEPTQSRSLETEKRQSREEREEDKSAPDGARTVREPLVAILGEELADGVIDHRKRLRKPLTPLAAKLLAGKFQSCPDPPAAAQAMIANGWQGIEPSWMKHDKPSDLQRRTSLAREFLTLPAGGTETGGG